MKAIVLADFGSVDQLEYRDIPRPFVAPHEVLVKTKAISINPVDIKTRKGKGQAARLKEDPPMILGWDISGVVEATGKDVVDFKAGDEVFGMINVPGRGKGYAEYVAANASHLARKPGNISHEEAAAASLAAMTAWQALFDKAEIKTGQRILIHAAAGGVGHFAVQFAKYAGAFVIGTSSARNKEFVLSLGADEHVDYKLKPFEEQVAGVDVVLDTIGGDNIPRSLKILRKGGVIVSLPSGISETVGEQAAEQGKKGIFFFVKSNGNDMQKIAGLLDQGKIKSHVSRSFSFAQIKEAHEQVESGTTVGKVVLKMEE